MKLDGTAVVPTQAAAATANAAPARANKRAQLLKKVITSGALGGQSGHAQESVTRASNVPKVDDHPGRPTKRARATVPPDAPAATAEPVRLTELQKKMKRALAGGKFRMINERLYTTTSGDAAKFFAKEPDMFQIYHEGFREQVKSWPSNPVDVYIEELSDMRPPGPDAPPLVIADLGCGDAALARALLALNNAPLASPPARKKPKTTAAGADEPRRPQPSAPSAAAARFVVHSFDLVAPNELVTACDIRKVPLADGAVDVTVFCLSLMGTNFLEFIAEAWRILRVGGQLKIAEVVSRFPDIPRFVAAVEGIGFTLTNKLLVGIATTSASPDGTPLSPQQQSMAPLPPPPMHALAARLATFAAATAPPPASRRVAAAAGSSGAWPHKPLPARAKKSPVEKAVMLALAALPQELAEAGFYFTPTEHTPDLVTCFMCGTTIGDWRAVDEPPLTAHEAVSPACSWVRLMGAAKRWARRLAVIRGDSDDEEDGARRPVRSRRGAQAKAAAGGGHAEMTALQRAQLEELCRDPDSAWAPAMVAARRETFKFGWPHEGKAGWACSSEKVAETGMYFCPSDTEDDYAECLYCHLGLAGWEETDDPRGQPPTEENSEETATMEKKPPIEPKRHATDDGKESDSEEEFSVVIEAKDPPPTKRGRGQKTTKPPAEKAKTRTAQSRKEEVKIVTDVSVGILDRHPDDAATSPISDKIPVSDARAPERGQLKQELALAPKHVVEKSAVGRSTRGRKVVQPAKADDHIVPAPTSPKRTRPTRAPRTKKKAEETQSDAHTPDVSSDDVAAAVKELTPANTKKHHLDTKDALAEDFSTATAGGDDHRVAQMEPIVAADHASPSALTSAIDVEADVAETKPDEEDAYALNDPASSPVCHEATIRLDSAAAASPAPAAANAAATTSDHDVDAMLDPDSTPRPEPYTQLAPTASQDADVDSRQPTPSQWRPGGEPPVDLAGLLADVLAGPLSAAGEAARAGSRSALSLSAADRAVSVEEFLRAAVRAQVERVREDGRKLVEAVRRESERCKRRIEAL
ncbi:25S rRNA (adenine645-N1)-methyltransferase [Cladochytrium tenue]|nr:25S rRNA (adenine645-N1)-methyltransferase [Cladochytrium tenue]